MKRDKRKDKQVFAEDLNFWRTGRKSSDKWIELAKAQIRNLGGVVLGEGFGSDDSGRAAFMLGFEISGDRFKIVWPVIKSKCGDVPAERRQSATTLYHVVKAKCIEAVIRGPRVAFAGDWLLPNGRTVGESTSEELTRSIPLLLSGPQ